MRKVKVWQEDRSILGGNFVINATFKIMDSSLVMGKFGIDAEVLDIRYRVVILELSWLMENRFSVATQDRCLRNINTGHVLPCSSRWIPEVLIMEEEPLKDVEILLIIDASELYSHYAQCFSTEQAARLPEHKSWNHQILL